MARRKKNSSRRFWKRLRYTAGATFFLLTFGLGFYLAQLYSEISATIRQRQAAMTSAIFSAPMVVAPGDDADKLHLVDRLRRLAYSEVPLAQHPGEFSSAPGAITIQVREFHVGLSTFPATKVALRLDGQRVASILDDAGVALHRVVLEPQVIGRLMPDAPAERIEVPLEELKPYLVDGLLAVEDRFFYYHPGFDPVRIIEAAINDLRSRQLEQGASTISQQLARTFIPPKRRSFRRKFRELAIALVLESQLPKREILARYINDVFMGEFRGAPIYGMPMAARYFFNKDVREVSPAEAAVLVAIVRAPTLYDPRRHPDYCKARRDLVLGVMQRRGLLDESTYQAALASPVETVKAPHYRIAPYFTDFVLAQVQKIPGFDGQLEGLRVYTTLDANLQEAAQESLEANLERLEKAHPHLLHDEDDGPLQSSMVATDVESGAIRAMVGGRAYSASQFNRAAMAQRQPGSAFKPIVYLNALDPDRCPLPEPLTLSSILPDRPMSFHGWTPADYEGSYKGDVTVADALAESLNIPTAYLGSLLGPRLVVQSAHELGIKEEMPAVLPITIGAGDTTLLELTAAYQVFAAGGIARPPYAIESVLDRRGHLILQHQVEERRLIREDVAYVMTGALEGVLERGTAARAASLGLNFAAAGKTGTTDDYHDAYFVGYTPRLVCGVWVGFDNPESIGLPGSQAALPAWVDFMIRAAPADPPEFEVPEGVVLVTVDPRSGGLATASCPKSIQLPYLTGSAPNYQCRLHGGGGGALAESDELPITTKPDGTISDAHASGYENKPSSPGVLGAVGNFFGSLFGRSP